MPLLWQHDASKPVGLVTFASPSATGIPFKAELPIIKEPGTLKDRVDEAIQSVRYRLVAAVSIGFQAVAGQVEKLKSGGLRFNQWQWLELSICTIPANSEAVIETIKAIDRKHLATSRRTATRTVRRSRHAVKLIPAPKEICR